MRVSGRQVHQLHGEEPHHDEPVPHQPGGAERGKDGIPEKPRTADMERLAGHGYKNRGTPDRTGHHGVLRYLFQRLRRLHALATRRPAQEPRDRRAQPRRPTGRERTGSRRAYRGDHRRDGAQAQGTEGGGAIVQLVL